MEESLREYIQNEVNTFRGKNPVVIDEEEKFHIAIEGSFGSHLVTPRHLFVFFF